MAIAFWILLFTVLLLPFLGTVLSFGWYLATEKQIIPKTGFAILQIWTVAIVPILFLWSESTQKVDCCFGGAAFAPAHRLSVFVVVFACLGAYFYSATRSKTAPPVMELFINSVLLIGLFLNVIVCFHLDKKEFGRFQWLLGNLPIVLLFTMQLIQNQKMLIAHLDTEKIEIHNWFGRLSWSLLNLRPIFKFPLLTILALPILCILSACLLIFGQKPDSLILAFTETYKYGFSQLDYLCDNVKCDYGDHYLCSVAAHGHLNLVKPQRYGYRKGKKIICNRQLLVSNAFEELLQERLPSLHKYVRRNYNRVGSLIHRYYYVFEIKYVSDLIYLIMKPLEWIFLLFLYTFDHKPENRIARQYVVASDLQYFETDTLKKGSLYAKF